MNRKPHLRLIGDVHQNICCKSLEPRSFGRNYSTLIKKATYSIQLGDMGFDYSWLANVDPARHCCITGNHENFPMLTPHFLRGAGLHSISLANGQFSFFYVHGAFSIDYQYRTIGRDWFPDDEQLSMEQCNQAIELYSQVKPDIVITHDAPLSLYPELIWGGWTLTKTRTNQLLEALLNKHQPLYWFFAHMHRNWVGQRGRTTFFCLNELAYLDFNNEGQLLYRVPQ